MEFVPEDELKINAEASIAPGKRVLHGHIPYEIIDGKKYPAYNAASYSQSVIRKNLFSIIVPNIDRKNYEITRNVYVDLEDTILASDVSVFRKPMRLREDIIDDVPIFVAEIVSPLNTIEDISAKKEVYERLPGIIHWTINPEKKTINIRTWTKGKYNDSVYSALDLVGISLEISAKDVITVPMKDVFKGLERVGDGT